MEECLGVHIVQLILHLMRYNLVLAHIQVLIAPAHSGPEDRKVMRSTPGT